MTPIFPGLESAEFITAFDSAISDIGDLAELFDKYGIRRRENSAVDGRFLEAFEAVTTRINSLTQKIWTLGAYIGCFTSTDAKNQLAQARESQLMMEGVTLDQLGTRYVAWVGTCDMEVLLERCHLARQHEYALRKAVALARHQMSEAEESLASELATSGINGWARLHGNLTAMITVKLQVDGEEKTLPMSAVRALGSHPDRDLRKRAHEAEIAAWEASETPIAAALNGVKGFQQTLRKRRNYDDDVQPTFSRNGIDRQTLEAMQQACVESFPDFRRYMAAKARALKLDHLAWYDVTAPVGESVKQWSWDEAERFILENFGQYSDRLRAFAEQSFTESWIDAEPRVGKEGGAYCTSVLPGVSRIMMNFDGSFNSVSTLAHELGHAYHNLNLRDRTPMQRETAMTLAETASIFCEAIAFEAAIQNAEGAERVAILDTSIQRDLGVVVDIHSRFLFESRVFQKRAQRDLTVAEFKELMVAAQAETYGPEVQPLHPYMWAVKGHYYGPLFYNYPYTFGLLFGLGLYAQFRQEPDAFRAKYDDFLSSTGLADSKTLTRRFGIDITTPDFWRSSLDVVRKSIAEFDKLA
jgi:pepF/M3 family oligoendopeptidase